MRLLFTGTVGDSCFLPSVSRQKLAQLYGAARLTFPVGNAASGPAACDIWALSGTTRTPSRLGNYST